MDVAIDPDALDRFVGTLDGTVPGLQRTVGLLEGEGVADPERAVAVRELASEVRSLADDGARSGRWISGVAHAVRQADGGWSGEVGRALGSPSLLALVDVRPELVGPIDGMPVASRVAANRVLIARALAATTDPVRRRRLRALLADDPHTHRPRQFLLFDPTGDGRLAEVFGSLDDADDVAIVVPGMSTELANFDRTVARPARALQERATGSRSVAVIAWLGYDPPDGFVSDIDELGALVRARRAREGGAALASFVDGLALGGRQTLTLVGHSYGSTTVGAALLADRSLHVDRVVVMGSPGVLVDRAADFGRPDTAFFALAARHDVVADLGWFGPSPSRRGSGFTRLEADGDGHSSYLLDGSRSQGAVADVIVGRVSVAAPR